MRELPTDMKILLAICVAIGLVSLASSQGCNIACLDTYRPVCGSKNSVYRTFRNDCLLRKHNACHRTDFKQEHEGPCNGL